MQLHQHIILHVVNKKFLAVYITIIEFWVDKKSMCWIKNKVGWLD